MDEVKKPTHKRTTTTTMCMPRDILNEVHEIDPLHLDFSDEEEEDMITESQPVEIQFDPFAEDPFAVDTEDEDDEEAPQPEPDLDIEQIRIIQRNATIVLLNNVKATLRFMRVDIYNQERHAGAFSAYTIAMRHRVEDLEQMIDAFEDNNLMGLQPRNLHFG